MKNIVIVFLFVLSSGKLYAQTNNIVYKTHTDKTIGVTIKYPSTWQERKVEGSAFFFIRPKEEQGQKFAENVNLIIDPPDDLSLEEFAGVAREKLNMEIKGFHEIKCEYVKIKGRDFFKIIYTFNHNTLKMHDVYYITMKDGRSYNIFFSALETTFSKYYPVFEKMIQSFELK